MAKYKASEAHNLGATITAHLNLGHCRMSIHVRNAVHRALTTGILAGTGGAAAGYMEFLTTRVGMPWLSYSQNGAGWGRMNIYRNGNDITSLAQPLSDWWKADRVSARMENATQWAQWENNPNRYGHDYVKEPHWGATLKGERINFNILSKTRYREEYDAISEALRALPGFAEKSADLVDKLRTNATFDFEVRP
jgi:hypothetical protein